jgi:hypothetical protein
MGRLELVPAAGEHLDAAIEILEGCLTQFRSVSVLMPSCSPTPRQGIGHGHRFIVAIDKIMD